MLQDIINNIRYDDRVAIYLDSSDYYNDEPLWEGAAYEYDNDVDEEKYRFDCMEALEAGLIGIAVIPIIND